MDTTPGMHQGMTPDRKQNRTINHLIPAISCCWYLESSSCIRRDTDHEQSNKDDKDKARHTTS